MTPRDFAERALLGCLLLEPGRIRDLEWLQPGDFRSPPHQTLYRHLAGMVAAADTRQTEHDAQRHQVPGVTPITLYEAIQDSGELGTTRSTLLTAPGLHTLMETAPPVSSAQPEAYANMVLESSIRRQITEAGIRVGQSTETSPELASVLDTVEQALDRVDDAQHRWQASTRSDTTYAPTELARRSRTRPDGDILDVETVAAAEYGLVEHILAAPSTLNAVGERVQPGDIADQQLATTFRSAQQVHADAARTGHHVDPVTVAWEQQRQQAQHGPGLDIEQLASMGRTIPLGDAQHCADTVLRGSLTRLTRSAAGSVQTAAQTPGLQPGDVIHTSRVALTAVTDTAERLARGSPAAHLAGQARPSATARAAEASPPHAGDRPDHSGCHEPAHQVTDLGR